MCVLCFSSLTVSPPIPPSVSDCLSLFSFLSVRYVLSLSSLCHVSRVLAAGPREMANHPPLTLLLFFCIFCPEKGCPGRGRGSSPDIIQTYILIPGACEGRPLWLASVRTATPTCTSANFCSGPQKYMVDRQQAGSRQAAGRQAGRQAGGTRGG